MINGNELACCFFGGGAFFLTVSGQTFLRGQILALLFPIDSQP